MVAPHPVLLLMVKLGDSMNTSKVRYDYRHPVFYSRKHPFYADNLPKEVRGALVAALAPTSPPF